MNTMSRKTTRPIGFPRTLRRKGIKSLTSLPAGKIVPLMAVPIFREDAVRSGKLNFVCEMQETAEILMNSVYCTLHAHLVPWLAFERFQGSMDIFDRSYNGLPPFDGEAVIDFFDHHAMGAIGSKEIYEYMGLHAKSATNVNTMYAEAYNAIFNLRAVNRSKDITQRTPLDTTLAPAFWRHENFAHIVPDFDQAVIDGEVPLNVTNAKMPISGIGMTLQNTVGLSPTPVKYADGTTSASPTGWKVTAAASPAAGEARLFVDQNPSLLGFPNIFAEMEANGITVSLSNLDLAKKTQAFARLREQFVGHNDDHIIDMLMSGISIPDQSLKQPVLLASETTVFGMSKRYASDAANLTESAVNGAAVASLNIRVPRIPTGGVIMVTAEITPEQLFERKKDVFFHIGSVAELPDALRDTLDPEKVDVVKNDYVDIDHDTPNGVFGYEPLNAKWSDVSYNIGGKFHRPLVDAAFDEDRQRLWAVEVQNPVLSEDFYLCTTMHTKPFLDTVADPFEAVTIAEFMIEGNTVFGGQLVEQQANYAAVLAEAPQDRIEK